MATTPATAAASALPKSGAVSKGYNFASTWEQVGRRALASGRSGRGRSRDLAGAIAGFVDLIPPLHFFHLGLLQNAPLTEQQKAAIAALSHAVSERPFPANLVRPRHLRIVCIFCMQCLV